MANSEPQEPLGDASSTLSGGLDVDALTWSAMLGRWVDFARAALVLPDDSHGHRLRSVVPDIIMLQACWFALGRLDGLPRDEQALGLDRGAILIEKHTERVRSAWSPDSPPSQLLSLIHDAHAQLALAQSAYDAASPAPIDGEDETPPVQ